jgi:hypothetical protein
MVWLGPLTDDPVREVEQRVDAICSEHLVLHGCDDPSCAVRTSSYINPRPPRPWWKRMLGLR